MANTLRDTFSDIADAIRAKGVTGTMTPLEMPTKIGSISGGGSKYGVPIDGLLGDVDQNGQLGNPTEPFSFTSNDIRTIGQYVLHYKFYNNAGITSLSLPNLTQVNQYGMQYMCQGCSNLASVNLPNLTTVGNYGMSYAFQNCTSLTSVDLSSISNFGLETMRSAFSGCTHLTSVDLSSLSSITSSNGMLQTFYGCTSLTSVDLSSLSSITGGSGMQQAFTYCTHLTSVDLSSLSSVTSSSGMNFTFQNCTALQEVKFNNATAIPAISSSTFQYTNSTFKIIVPNALYEEWKKATNWSAYASQIEKAYPGVEFKATTAGSTIKLMAVGSPSPVSLKYSVNYGTFSTYTIGDTITLTNVGDNVIFLADTNGNATFSEDSSNYYKFVITGSMSVEETPEYLLDESGELNAIPDYAFYGLFEDCTGLDNAPPLPNTSLGEYCYASMFKGCTELTTAPTLPATTLATGCYNNMFYGCSSLNSITLDYTGNFSTTYFDNWVNGVSAGGTLKYRGSDTTVGDYAIPTGWTVDDWFYDGLTFVAESAGATVKLVKHSNAPNVTLQYTTDSISWQDYTVGTAITLTNIGDKVGFIAKTYNTRFGGDSNSQYNGWEGTGQLSVKGNINSLLDKDNYNYITDLNARGSRIFQYLFYGMTALVSAEDLTLPATTIGNYSYNNMFENCTNLTKAPKEIPAVTVSGSQWPMAGMFKNTAITKSPYLRCPSSSTSNGFQELFQNCSNLEEIKLDWTGNFGTSAFTNWVNGVAASGTFYYNGSYTGRGTNAIPTGWTITPFTPAS